METIAPTATVPSERPAALDERTLNNYRRLGYLLADLDPMNRIEPEAQPGLEGAEPATADYARSHYCGTIGVEFMHIPDPARRRWIEERLEAEAPAFDQRRILDLLTRAETFEQFIQARYLATKLFSVVGVEALLPCLDQMLQGAAAHPAHQGRVAMS